jgi:hypothetical protein
MRNAADRLPWIMMCAAETSDSERSGASAGQWRTAEATTGTSRIGWNREMSIDIGGATERGSRFCAALAQTAAATA